MPVSRTVATPLLLTALLAVACDWGEPRQVAVTVDPADRFQTMTGWEAVAQAGHSECTGFAAYREELFDRAIDELGLNRLRLELYSSVERRDDPVADLAAGRITSEDWIARRQQAANDNADPNTIDPAGFRFTGVDDVVERIVLPLARRLEARGERLFLNLTYVDFAYEDAFEHRDHPAEYAELVVATFQHLESRYGLVPDALEIILEPDNAGWTPEQVGHAIVAAGDRLREAGYRPAIIAPSTANTGEAVRFYDGMIAIPRVLEYLTDIGYHRYGSATAENLFAIGERVERDGVGSGMLEHIGSGFENLHEDLTLALASGWQQFALAFCTDRDDGSAYFRIVGSDPPRLVLSRTARYLAQYFRHVRIGAVRVRAQADGPVRATAFLNPDSSLAVILAADRATSFLLDGLPPGAYTATFTTDRELASPIPGLRADPGQPLVVTIPRRGVLTVRTASGS